MSTGLGERDAKIALCGALIDVVRLEEAAQRVLSWATDRSQPAGCRVVLTPNVHHAVLLYEQPALREAYRDADLVLADGAPIVALSRARRRPLPERVAGSDLVPAVLAAAPPGLRVFLLGAGPGVAARAADEIHRQWPDVRVVGWSSPPHGFEDHASLNASLVEEVNASEPDVLVVGLGAPKQELWVHRHRSRLRARVVVCAGATIDFLAGEQTRAPRWMQRYGLEWLYRIGCEPGRLIQRYAHDGRVFARIAWSELRNRPLVPSVLDLRHPSKPMPDADRSDAPRVPDHF